MKSLKIGVTGGIGSGKTMVCNILEAMGYPVFYSDKVARDLQNNDPILIQEIIALLGEEAYKNKEINRPYIAEKIFSDTTLLKQLNELVHPKVRAVFQEFVLQNKTSKFVFNEAAIIFETGLYEQLDATILVCSDNEIKIQRTMERDGISREQVTAKIANQWSQEKLKELADFVIQNDSNSLLIPQINTFLEEFTNQHLI